jgi:hypothetical protein
MSELTPEQAAARDAIAAQDPGQPLNADPAELGAQLAAGQAAADQPIGAAPDAPDPAQLLAMIQDLQTRYSQLEQEKRTTGAAPLISTAESFRNAVADHVSGKTTGHQDADKHAEIQGLADDLLDAAHNAVGSGNGDPVLQLARRVEAALRRIHPGPGDHHYFRQAESFIGDVPELADQLAPPTKFAAVGSSRAPAKVVQGSVTG